MKKVVKARLALTTAIITILSLVLTSVTSMTAVAESNDGSKETAKKKLYAMALSQCINDSAAWAHSGSGLTSKELLDGKWFIDSAIQVYGIIPSGAIIEQAMEKSYGDGKIACGENDFVTKTLSTLGVSVEDVICNYTGTTYSGILAVDETKTTCHDALSQDSYTFKTYPIRSDYYDDLINGKVFGGDPPGGDWDTFTDLERYYIYYDSFTSVCAAGSPNFGSTAGYQVPVYNPATQQIETAGFSQKDGVDGNKGILLYNGRNLTCSQLATDLAAGTAFVAYKNAIEAAGGNAESLLPDTQSHTGSGTGTGSATSNPENTSNEPNCWNTAQSLGWILCPILDFAQDTVNYLYENIYENFLQVNPRLFTGGNANSGTGQAWGVFQTFANIILVIFLLIIIISQLTGIGINNYGIKKILPQLIIAAVIANLSYIICVLAVDISNILGNGLNNLFNSIPVGVESVTLVENGNQIIVGLGSTVITALLGVGAGAGLLLTFGGGIGLLLALIPTVISAVISLLFTFLLLAARQAGVVILTVIAPVAMVLYMLPNTKKWFDKWVKAYSGLLMLYPICGAMIGGCNYAGKVLLVVGAEAGGGGFFFTLAAMLINIIPFFFIPTLLRGSFSALGNIGNRIGALGQRWGRAASGAVRRNEGYRNATAMARAGIRYGKDGKLHERRTVANALRHRASRSGVGAISRAGSRSLARGVEESQRIASMDARAKRLAGVGGIEAIEAEVSGAEAALNSANAEFTTSEGKVNAAKEKVKQAKAAVTAIQNGTGQPGLSLAAATLAVTTAEDELKAAQAAHADVTTARDKAQTAYDGASARLREARPRLFHGAAANAVARQHTDMLTLGAQNRATIGAEAAIFAAQRDSRPAAVDNALALLRSNDENTRVNEIESRISTNDFVIEGVNGGKKINSGDASQLEAAFTATANRYAQSVADDPTHQGDEDLRRLSFALFNRMSALQNPGRSAQHRAINTLLENGLAESESGQKFLAEIGAYGLSKNGDAYHRFNRAFEQTLTFASTGDFDRLAPSHGFNADQVALANLNKYAPDTLVGADDATIDTYQRLYETDEAHGGMNATQRATYEKMLYEAKQDSQIWNHVKGTDRAKFEKVIANHAASRTISVDNSGTLTQTTQRVGSSAPDAPTPVTYAKRDGSGMTSNFDDIKNDYADAVEELDTGISKATGATLTDEQRANATRAVRESRALLDQTAQGRQFVRQHLTDRVATAATASAADDYQAGDGTKLAAGLVTAENSNADFASFSKRVSNGEKISKNEFMTRATVAPAAGAPAGTAPTVTYDLKSESAPIEYMHDAATGKTYETRTVAEGVREYREVGSATATATNWQALPVAAAATWALATAAPRQVIVDDGAGGGKVANVITLNNGQTVQVQSPAGTPPVTTTNVINNIDNASTTINNATTTPDDRNTARETIEVQTRLAQTSESGVQGLNDLIRRMAPPTGGAASEGLKTVIAQIPQGTENKFDSGVQQIIQAVRGGQNLNAQNTYQPREDKVYDHNTSEEITRVEKANGKVEYRDSAGNAYAGDPQALETAAQRRDRNIVEQNSHSQFIQQLIAKNSQRGPHGMGNSGPHIAADARFVRQKDSSGRPTEFSRLTSDSAGRNYDWYFNHRTGEYTQTPPTPPTPPTP